MEDERELELVNSFKEYLEILIKDFSDIEYDKIYGKNRHGDGRTVRFYRVFITQLVSRLKDIASEITVADILRFSMTDEFNCHDPVIIPMKDRFQQVKVGNNLQNFRNRPLELGNRYVANLSGYVDDYTITIFNRSMTSPEIRIWNGKILDYRLVRRLVSENDPMQIEHEITIYNPIANLKYIKEYNEIADKVSNSDDEPSDVDVDIVKNDGKTMETDMFETVYETRRCDIRNRFIEYLNFLIKDFKDIEYDKVQSEERGIELLAKDFVKDLTKLLEVLKTKVTISDILGYISVEMFADGMPVVIMLDDRFKSLTIPDNLIDLRKLTIDLGNNYSITAQGNPEHFSIIIKNNAITSPILKDENPGGAILFYRIEKFEDSRGSTHYKHSICVKHPLANLKYIKEYNEITAEISNSDDESSDTDAEMVKVDAPVTLYGNDGDKVKTTYSVLKRELEFKNSFQEYLNILIEDFERVDLDNPYKIYTVELAAYNKFCKDFIKNLVKLLTAIRTSATVVDILGPFRLEKLPDDLPVTIALKDKFKKLPVPSNIANFHNKSLEIGNHYRIDVKGNSDEHKIIICNPPMTSTKVSNPDSEIIRYRIVRAWDSEDNVYFEHEIIISNPIANLRFIKCYIANLGLIKRYEESSDEYVEEPVELDEEYVESDDELMEDCDDTTVIESENTETKPSDNTANVNISLTEGNKEITLTGPNGSKISINLSINISFN